MPKIYDAIIIGGGPAGMTAALNILRGGKTCLLIEREAFGGQIATSPRVENIPSIKSISGADFSSALFDQIDELGVEFATCTAWADGGNGAIDLANKVMTAVENNKQEFKFLYDLDLSLKNKIKTVATEIYGAKNVVFLPKASKKLKQYTEDGFDKLPICIAKTQYSFSDDPKKLECKEPFKIHVQDVVLKAGAGFVVVLAGKIFTMPGLPRIPAAENIDLDDKGNIIGLF
jgi:formate--tetrahydrofolate ligase